MRPQSFTPIQNGEVSETNVEHVQIAKSELCVSSTSHPTQLTPVLYFTSVTAAYFKNRKTNMIILFKNQLEGGIHQT